jgi:hypothetical protein
MLTPQQLNLFRQREKKIGFFIFFLPATTEMFLPLYRSTNKSIVSLKALGSSNRVVMSWNIIPVILSIYHLKIKNKKCETK